MFADGSATDGGGLSLTTEKLRGNKHQPMGAPRVPPLLSLSSLGFSKQMNVMHVTWKSDARHPS